jgi:hypothetical protein
MIPKKRLHNFAVAGTQIANHDQQTAEVRDCSLDEVVLDIEQAADSIAHDCHRTKG